MRKSLLGLLPVLLIGAAFAGHAHAGQLGVGFLSIDIPDDAGDPNSYEFDVTNFTGLDDSGGSDPSTDPFPISTQLLTNVSNLLVIAADGTTMLANLGSAYFSLDADGQSLTGGALGLNAANPPGSATITGTFSTTTITLEDGSVVTIDPTFTAVLTDGGGAALMDQDFVEIFATTTGTTPPSAPEPGTWVMLGSGLIALAFSRRLKLRISGAKVAVALVLGAMALGFVSSADAAVFHLNTFTNPSSGVAGATTVYVSGTGFPAGGTVGNTTLAFATTCGAAPAATSAPSSVTQLLPGTDRVGVLIPAALSTTGNYFITVTMNGVTSSNCSEVTVTVPVKFSGACLPSSSIGLGINATAKVATAYVPNGYWESFTTGLNVVQLEPTGVAPIPVSTPGVVNACSASPSGQAVCTANNTDVYVLNGSTVSNTLSSGSDTVAGYSGGQCMNCGVAINPSTNQAVVSMGLSGFGGAYQFVNLGASPSFVGPPIGVANEPSENIVWDATRNLIMSPTENRTSYDVTQVGTGAGTIAEFTNPFPANTNGSPDSAGEDCATGIIVSTQEFTGELTFFDLTQAVFTPSGVPGSPGSWSSPGQTIEFPEFEPLGAGTSGMAVAPGSHLAVISGEFGGNVFGVVQLPATSGSGTPSPVDYVAAGVPSVPSGCGFSVGFDPHTVTAYTSPNSGKALAVMANSNASWLALVDMQGLLAAPRVAGTHNVDTTMIDLVASGIVSFVGTGNSDPCTGTPTAKGALGTPATTHSLTIPSQTRPH